MDIIKTKKAQPWYKHKNFMLVVATAVFLLLLVALQFGNWGQYTIERYTIVTAKVKKGDFRVNISSSGTLVSRDPRLITSNVDGRVEKILVHAGDNVEQGQILFELSNPDIERRVKELQWEVSALELELAALEQQHKTQLLNFEDQMLNNKLRYDVENLRLKAEDELVQGKQGTVSMIDFEIRKLSVSELSKRVKMDKVRLEQLKITLDSEFKAARARLERLKKTEEQAEFEKSSLSVRAPVSGILQEMTLELGQRVSPGDNIARLAQRGDLIAMLNVPELNASDIAMSQTVVIDTRFNQIPGRVSRIDPAVNNGVVQVEVELIGELPIEARPDLSVMGEISVTEKKNILYVRRPFKVLSNKSMGMFKLTSEGDLAHMTKVTFGTLSSTDIEVVSGVNMGDELIISDISDYSQHDEVKVTN